MYCAALPSNARGFLLHCFFLQLVSRHTLHVLQDGLVHSGYKQSIQTLSFIALVKSSDVKGKSSRHFVFQHLWHRMRSGSQPTFRCRAEDSSFAVLDVLFTMVGDIDCVADPIVDSDTSSTSIYSSFSLSSPILTQNQNRHYLLDDFSQDATISSEYVTLSFIRIQHF